MKRYDVKTLVADDGVAKVWLNFADMPMVADNEDEAIKHYKDYVRWRNLTDFDCDSLSLADDYFHNMVCKAVEKEV